MNQKSPPSSAEELVSRIDEVLEGFELHGDFRRGSLIALDFCDLMTPSLNDEQKAAVEAARSYWNGVDTGDHRAYVKMFADITRRDQLERANGPDAAINRLVWCALNTNTEFSGYEAEFLTFLGVDAGLGVLDMNRVFSKYLPGLPH